MPLTTEKVKIVLTGGPFIICANCYDLLHRLWKNFSASTGLPNGLHTNSFDALHQLKTEILQMQTIHQELQRVEIKRKIEFALRRIKEFASFILHHRTIETSHDITLAGFNITNETIYLHALLTRLARG